MQRFSNVPQAWLEKVEEDKVILVQLSKSSFFFFLNFGCIKNTFISTN